MAIPLEACKHRGVYRIKARNITIGVFDEPWKTFIGIREKWGRRFLDREYHWDCGPPHGTATPLEELPVTLPEDMGLDTRDPATHDKLFAWLDEYKP